MLIYVIVTKSLIRKNYRVAAKITPGKMAAKNTPAAGGSGGILAIIFPGFFLAATLYILKRLSSTKKTSHIIFKT